MRLVKDYMNNDTMRHALNELTEKTFGFNFESWVTNLILWRKSLKQISSG